MELGIFLRIGVQLLDGLRKSNKGAGTMGVKLKSSFSLHDQFREWQELGEMTDTLLVTRGGSVAIHSLTLLVGDGSKMWSKILSPNFAKDDPIIVLLPDYNLEQLEKAVSHLYAPTADKMDFEPNHCDSNNNDGDDECTKEGISENKCLMSTFETKIGYVEQQLKLKSLKKHELKQGKNKPQSFVCDQCPRDFKLFCHLNIHKRTHTGEKPYPCDVCGKRFSESGSMKKHKMRHTGERPFICDTCSKAFATRGDLYVHKRIHNRTLGEKIARRFLCDICSKSFSQVNNLTVHKRIHTGEKPYSCELCQKNFTQSSDLKTHIRTHNGDKPFQCHLCPVRFSTNANMKRHILIHTGEKPYTCDQCPRAFNQPDPLKKHKLTHN